MSSVIPGCDSDEEVFWGPVTAKELEIIWRSRMANKNQAESANPVGKFVKSPDGLHKSSDQNVCSSSSSVQEVPSLHDFRKFSDSQKVMFEVNNHDQHLKHSEPESVGYDSTLPLLEASMEINQNPEEILMVNDSSVKNDNINTAEQVSEKHDVHLPESSNQSDNSMEILECPTEVPVSSMAIPDSAMEISENSMEIPKNVVMSNVNLGNTQDTVDKNNFSVDNLSENPQENTELFQADDAGMSMSDSSKECSEPIEEGTETSDISLTNCNKSSSENCTNHDQLSCSKSHNSAECQEVSSVNVTDSVEHKSIMFNSENIEPIILTASEDQSELSGSMINMALNQSNIENIPPEQPENVDHKVEVNGSDVTEHIDPYSKTKTSNHRLNGDNVLQEIQIENEDDSLNSKQSSKIDKVGDADTNSASETSDEKSFVSVNSEEDNCVSSSNSQYSSANQEESLAVKNKENEEPCVQSNQDGVKSKIPVLNHIKPTFIKPARLQHAAGISNEKWLSDLKRKKIPKPKKPDYMVSPAKLGSILKSRNQPTPPIKAPVVDVKRSAQTKVGSSTPKATTTPTPIPGTSKSFITPKKKQYEFIKSPISEYIRTGTGIPNAKSLPALKSPHKIPVPLSVKQTPVQKLPPKFYSSAEKLVIKPGPSTSVLKPAENRLLLTPKIFKHQGRIADLKKPGDINVVTPRAVRKTSLTETSFACLPQTSKQLDVSVLEEL